MDLKGLKKPTKKKIQKPVGKPEKVVTLSSNNLHKAPRGQKIPKQFKISEGTLKEFEIAARERGYNNRQSSDFFLEIWEYWQEHH